MSVLPSLPDVPTLSVAERRAQLAALTDAEAAAGAAAPEPDVVEAAGAAARCAGVTAAGEPCAMFRLRGSLFCWHHDPDRRAAAEGAEAVRVRAQDAAREARAAAKEWEAWACRLEEPAQLVAFVRLVARAAWDRRIAPDDAQVCLEGARLLAELARGGAGAAPGRHGGPAGEDGDADR